MSIRDVGLAAALPPEAATLAAPTVAEVRRMYRRNPYGAGALVHNSFLSYMVVMQSDEDVSDADLKEWTDAYDAAHAALDRLLNAEPCLQRKRSAMRGLDSAAQSEQTVRAFSRHTRQRNHSYYVEWRVVLAPAAPSVARGARKRGAGRPGARRVATRSSSRSGDSGDSDSEPPAALAGGWRPSRATA